jgi:putative solute:sodium symporter small subunit
LRLPPVRPAVFDDKACAHADPETHGVLCGPTSRKEVTAMKVSENHQAYWRKNLRITAILLGIWFVVTFVMAFFARDLNFNFFGWPFSFYMAAQGSLVIYVAIIWFYAHYMNNLDIEHGVQEEE